MNFQEHNFQEHKRTKKYHKNVHMNLPNKSKMINILYVPVCVKSIDSWNEFLTDTHVSR